MRKRLQSCYITSKVPWSCQCSCYSIRCSGLQQINKVEFTSLVWQWQLSYLTFSSVGFQSLIVALGLLFVFVQTSVQTCKSFQLGRSYLEAWCFHPSRAEQFHNGWGQFKNMSFSSSADLGLSLWNLVPNDSIFCQSLTWCCRVLFMAATGRTLAFNCLYQKIKVLQKVYRTFHYL